jgi:DNA-directed RNA polymerase specialized sigma24 family protein
VDELEIASPAPDDQLLALNDALDRFAGIERQQAELVKLRYFVGLKTEEAAEVLGISNATAKRWWAYAGRGCFTRHLRYSPDGQSLILKRKEVLLVPN